MALAVAFAGIKSTIQKVDRQKIDPQVRDFVLAASIFLAHAELENYISDLFNGYAVAACALAKKGSALSEYLRSHLFVERGNFRVVMGNFIAGSGEKELLEAVAWALRTRAGATVNDAASMPAFDGKTILASQKYPSEDNLRKIFTRIGVANVFDLASRYLRQDAAALLESLGSLRTQLAHTASLPGISAKDVRDRLDDTARFAGAIDRVMFSAAGKYYEPAAWSSHMR